MQRASERRGASACACGCRCCSSHDVAAVADEPRANGDVASGEISAGTKLHHGPLDRRVARRLRVNALPKHRFAVVQDGVNRDCVCFCHGPISFSLCIADFMHAMRLGPRHALPPRRWTFGSRVSARAAPLRTSPLRHQQPSAARSAIRRSGFSGLPGSASSSGSSGSSGSSRRARGCLRGVWSSFGHAPHFGQPLPVPPQSVRCMFSQTDSFRKGFGCLRPDFAMTRTTERRVSVALTVSCVDAVAWVSRSPKSGSPRFRPRAASSRSVRRAGG